MASGLRGGRLRHKITIQELPAGSPRQSSSGMRTDSWATFASVRAGIRALSGRELEAAQQRNAALEVEIEIRYLAGVAAGMRALHLGVYYPILAARDPDLRARRLLLDCSAGVVNPAAVNE
jgi:SPP1 family predicted phage head-tail adaptor